MGYNGSLQKMEITAFKDPGFRTPLSIKPNPFQVCINPEKYSEKYEVSYARTQAQGANGRSPAFHLVRSESLDLELVFDGTGVVPTAIPGVLPFTGNGIADQLDTFRKIVFEYNGEIHSPNYLRLKWGSLEFDCVLEALDITYTMFKPDGTPLRATVACSFQEYTSPIELEEEANNQSPDVTHVLTVKGGDTLPLLCYQVYGSSVYYLQVAEANAMTGFRHLEVGETIEFPPLEEASA